MTGFVYKWTNNVNGMWYIGSHKGTPDDGYRHSSVWLTRAEEKYGIENFTREILFEGDYEKDQIRQVVETEFLQKEDAANNPMSYNLINNAGHSSSNKEKISKALKGVPKTKEHCENISKGKKGKPQSEEHKRNRAKTRIGMVLGPQKIVDCPYCDVSGGITPMKRWHFDNCKEKDNVV